MKFLIESKGLYTVEQGILKELEETEITPDLFEKSGSDELPDWDCVKELERFSLLCFDENEPKKITACLKGTPEKQYIGCVADLSDESVVGIKGLCAEYTGSVTARYAFGEEAFTEEMPMSEFLTKDLSAGVGRKIRFEFGLEKDASLSSFVIRYRNGDDDDG